MFRQLTQNTDKNLGKGICPNSAISREHHFSLGKQEWQQEYASSTSSSYKNAPRDILQKSGLSNLAAGSNRKGMSINIGDGVTTTKSSYNKETYQAPSAVQMRDAKPSAIIKKADLTKSQHSLGHDQIMYNTTAKKSQSDAYTTNMAHPSFKVLTVRSNPLTGEIAQERRCNYEGYHRGQSMGKKTGNVMTSLDRRVINDPVTGRVMGKYV